MLAVPGALVALGLAYLAALGTAERDRRELALLRARGASRRDAARVRRCREPALGLVAGLLGAGVALAAVTVAGHGRRRPDRRARLVAVAACVALAFAGALAARLAASRRSRSVARRAARSAARGTPLWQRLYLDVLALVAQRR